MSLLINDLKESYLKWLRERIQYKEIEDAIEITTPLLDRHNDYLQIYVTQSKSGKLRLTDAGYILDDLEMDGVDVFRSPRRKEIFNTILNGCGVSCSKSKELFTESSVESFPQKKHMLLQAMMTVNDMFMTARSNITSLFMEDVAAFLEQHDIRNTPNISFIGKTGFTHRFDFVIPKSKDAPERIIKSVNSSSKQQTSLTLFMWNDTREYRGHGSELYVFINDSARSSAKDNLAAYDEYAVRTVLWSRRTDVLPQLTA